MIRYDIFVYCNWFSNQWQWSEDLYKNSKETAIYKRRNNTQNNTETQNTQNRKQKYEAEKHKTNIIKHKSSNQKIAEEQIIMRKRTTQNQHTAT